MSCYKWVSRISRMLDDSLTDGELRELKEHLAACAECRAELLLQKKINTALCEEVHSGLPADFTMRVAEKALEISKRDRRPRPWLVLVPPLATATAVVALFFMVRDLAAANPSMFESVAAGLVKPIAWVWQAASGLGGAVAAHGRGMASIDRLSDAAASMILASLIGIVPGVWGFHRVLRFIRE